MTFSNYNCRVTPLYKNLKCVKIKWYIPAWIGEIYA